MAVTVLVVWVFFFQGDFLCVCVWREAGLGMDILNAGCLNTHR